MSEAQYSESELHEKLNEVAERLSALERSVMESALEIRAHLVCMQLLLEIRDDLRTVREKVAVGPQDSRDSLCKYLDEELHEVMLPDPCGMATHDLGMLIAHLDEVRRLIREELKHKEVSEWGLRAACDELDKFEAWRREKEQTEAQES